MAKRVGLTLVQRAYDTLMPNPPGVSDFAGVKRIALGLIDPHPDQPRRGELPEVPELAENIRRYGLLQPIVVAPPAAGRYQLIAGARRLAAFTYLRDQDLARGTAPPSPWADIPAFVRDAGTLDRLLMALSENLSRHNLSDADTVLAVRTLHDMHAWTATEIAGRIGTSIGWVSQILGVARDAELADHVQAHRLTIAKAQEIRTARTPEARTAALTVALRGGSQPAIRQAKRLAGLSSLNPPPATRPGGGDPARRGGRGEWSGVGQRDAPAGAAGQDGLRTVKSLPRARATADASAGAGARAFEASGVASGVSGGGHDADTSWGEHTGRAGPDVAPSSARTTTADETEAGPQAAAAAPGPTPEPVATAAPGGGARDLAEVAREFGLTGHFADLRSTSIFVAGLRHGLATFDVEAMMKAMREDLRRLEGLVRTAQVERRG